MGLRIDQNQELLRDVSRSFYLSLRVLPVRLRPVLGCAYLLARASDTVADAPLLSSGERFEILDLIESDIEASTARSVSAVRLVADKLRHDGERRLMLRWSEVLGVFAKLSFESRALVRKVLKEIIGGQRLDVETFQPGSLGEGVRFLADEQAFHRYTYAVAGSVGVFWTEAVRQEYPGSSRVDWDQLREWGEVYGRGLQMLNIVRDMPADWRLGRCYIPLEFLPVVPAGGWVRKHFPAEELRPFIDPWLSECMRCLESGEDYWQSLRGWRLRLASQLPVAIARPTLEGLRAADAVAWDAGVKVSRRRVQVILARSMMKSICW